MGKRLRKRARRNLWTSRKECTLAACWALLALTVSGRAEGAGTHRVVAHFDCAKDCPAEQYFGQGNIRVVDSAIGRYREAEGKPLSRFGYRFSLEHVDKPHVAVIRYPEDKRRFMCVMDSTCYDLTTGVYTDFEHPVSGKMQEIRRIFWPRWTDCSIVFMTWGHGEPAAVSEVTIYELDGLAPLEVPGDSGDGSRREFGIQLEDPGGTCASLGALTHQEWLDRTVAYMRHSGQRVLAYPIVWYHGPGYPSEREPCSHGDVVVGRDRRQYVRWTAHPADWVAETLDRFDKEGLEFKAVVTLLRLGSLMKQMNIDLPSIQSGAATINNMLKSNHVQAGSQDWTYQYNVMNYPDKLAGRLKGWAYGELSGQPYRTGPIFNPLHPVVQEAIVGLAKEIAERYGRHRSFQGISFNMWHATILWYASLDSGYDDYTVGLFSKETGIAVPVDARAPDRFSKRHALLTGQHREKWVAWRCKRVRELFRRIRDVVVAARPDLRVTITLWSETTVAQMLGFPKTPGHQLYARQSTADLYRDGGFDIDLYRSEPGIDVDLCFTPSRDRDCWGTAGVQAPIEHTAMFRDHDFLDGSSLNAVHALHKPGAYIFNSWVEAWGKHKWFGCEPDDTQAKALAVMCGKPAEGIFRINSEYPKDGFWWDSQLRITPPLPSGDHFLEHYAHAVAQLDACRITRGGLFIEPVQTERLRRFALAYRALPAEKFETVGTSTDPVAVRTLVRDGKRYLYLVNREYYPVAVEVRLDKAGRATDLATNQTHDAPTTWRLTLGPYALYSFTLYPEIGIRGFSASAPREIVAGLREEAEAALETIRRLAAAGAKPPPGTDRMAADIKAAIQVGRYAWLRRALHSYIVRKCGQLAASVGKTTTKKKPQAAKPAQDKKSSESDEPASTTQTAKERILAVEFVRPALQPKEAAKARQLQRSLIWHATAPVGKQAYVVFRKTLSLETVPTTAVLRIFADSRYILWINGQYVERGPCRFDPIAPEYDAIDVHRFLRKGKNVLTVLVHHYTDGKRSGPAAFCGRIMRHEPGLTVRLDVGGSSGDESRALITDETWRVCAKTRFRPSPLGWGSIPDEIDARLDDGDWTKIDYGDSAWGKVKRVDGTAWGILRPRSIPLLREAPIAPLTLLEHVWPSEGPCARWIWTREKGPPAQKAPRWSAPEGVRYFRKTFALPEQATEVVIHATADNEFDCFFNGKQVGQNHVGTFSSWTTMQRTDVTKLAGPGQNTIAIRAINKHYGNVSDPAGLLVLVTWRDGNSPRHLVSDGSWKASECIEEGWKQSRYDDAAWPAALDMCAYGDDPWKHNIRNYPGPRTVDTEARPLAKALPLEIDAGAQVVIDAGVTEQAYSILDLDAEDGTRIELAYAQRFLDTGRRPDQVFGQRGTYIARAGRQTYMSGDTFGFKYLVIRVRSGRMRLHDVKLIRRRYPFDRVGAFRCNDPVLNTLWDICVHTVEVCSEDAYVDCASRERVEWMGDVYVDTYPVTRVALAGPPKESGPCWSDPRLLRNLLRHIGQSLQPGGRLKAHHPSDRWDIHGYIEDYACLWVNSLRDYFDNTGDLGVARELWPALTDQMKWFLDHRTERGLVRAREFIFFGNPLCYKTCEAAALNAYVCHALRDAAFLAEMLGRDALAGQYEREANTIASAVNTHLWDQRSGTYCGAIMNGAKTPPTAHAAVLCLYHGIVPEDRRASLTRWMLENHAKEGFAPYTHYFLFHELYRVGTDEADQLVLDLMRQRYGPMTEGETETVWEAFGGNEFCHQAGSAPAYFLSAYVLGVRVSGPVSERRILIEPRLADLKEAEGVVQTEFGLIPVTWKRTPEGALSFRFEVPRDVMARVAIPTRTDEPTLIVNGKTLVFAGKAKSAGISIRPRSVRFEVGAGQCSGRVSTGHTP